MLVNNTAGCLVCNGFSRTQGPSHSDIAPPVCTLTNTHVHILTWIACNDAIQPGRWLFYSSGIDHYAHAWQRGCTAEIASSITIALVSSDVLGVSERVLALLTYKLKG